MNEISTDKDQSSKIIEWRSQVKMSELIEGNMGVPELIMSPVLDQNSIAMNNIKLNIRSNTGMRQEVQIRDFSGKTILDLKKKYFAADMKSGK